MSAQLNKFNRLAWLYYFAKDLTMKPRITEFIVLALGWAVSRVNHWLKEQFKNSDSGVVKLVLLHTPVMKAMETNADLRLATKTIDVYWHFSGANTEDVIRVHPEKSFQALVGFGGAFTDAACFNFDLLSEVTRAELFRDLFSPASQGGLGLYFCRVCIGSSDYATHVYGYD